MPKLFTESSWRRAWGLNPGPSQPDASLGSVSYCITLLLITHYFVLSIKSGPYLNHVRTERGEPESNRRYFTNKYRKPHCSTGLENIPNTTVKEQMKVHAIQSHKNTSANFP